MLSRSKLNLQEEEALSTEVQRFPCLYEKSNAGYKEKDRKQNAWKKVELALGFEEGMYCFHANAFLL